MSKNELTPSLEELVSSIEGDFHKLTKLITDRDDAIAVKQRISLPLGVLNSKFELTPNSSRASRMKSFALKHGNVDK